MYDSNRMADPTFGIRNQALAVLAVLAQEEPSFARWDEECQHYKVVFNTYPWYNGREAGICISMASGYLADRVLNIAVFEHRNSDSLCCLEWETKGMYLNGPNGGDWDATLAKAYHSGNKWYVAASFPYLAIGECVAWIRKTFAAFYEIAEGEG